MQKRWPSIVVNCFAVLYGVIGAVSLWYAFGILYSTVQTMRADTFFDIFMWVLVILAFLLSFGYFFTAFCLWKRNNEGRLLVMFFAVLTTFKKFPYGIIKFLLFDLSLLDVLGTLLLRGFNHQQLAL